MINCFFCNKKLIDELACNHFEGRHYIAFLNNELYQEYIMYGGLGVFYLKTVPNYRIYVSSKFGISNYQKIAEIPTELRNTDQFKKIIEKYKKLLVFK